MSEIITVVDVIVSPPALIEVVTGEKGDPGPPGPPGIPGPHAASHDAGGADPVTVTALAGYPGGTTAFLRADHTFAAPPAAVIPTAPLEQVLVSQGAGVPPVFSPVLTLATPTPFAPTLVLANHAALGSGVSWRLSVGSDGNLEIRLYDETGVRVGPGLTMDPYGGSLSSFYSGFVAPNGMLQAKWLILDSHTYADINASAKGLGNLANISDSTTNTPGAVIAAGGTFTVLARWNGSSWIVVSG